MRRAAAIGAALAAALVLAACGGGSSTSTTASTAPAPKPGQVAARQVRVERRAAGRAAPFVAPESDNSIPTFGKEAGAGERAEAEADLRAYLTARAARDWAEACSHLARTVVQGYEKLASRSAKSGVRPTCARILPALAPLKAGVPADPLGGHLLSLRVQGSNAFALFYGPGDQQYVVPMNREDGRWLPTEAAPIAYPPGSSG